MGKHDPGAIIAGVATIIGVTALAVVIGILVCTCCRRARQSDPEVATQAS